MQSTVNGTRRCPLDTRKSCPLCEHWEKAPMIQKDGKNVKDARCGKRQQTFGTNLLVYRTDAEGNLLDPQSRRISLDNEKGPILENGDPAELVYEVYLWRFNAERFTEIRQIKKDWGSLRKHDVTFTLAESRPENFQDFSPTISPVSAWLLLSKQSVDKVKEVASYYEEHKFNAPAILGKEYTDEELLGFIGQGSGANAGDAVAATATEIENELAKIGQPDQPQVTPPSPSPTPEGENLDKLLENI